MLTLNLTASRSNMQFDHCLNIVNYFGK